MRNIIGKTVFKKALSTVLPITEQEHSYLSFQDKELYQSNVLTGYIIQQVK